MPIEQQIDMACLKLTVASHLENGSKGIGFQVAIVVSGRFRQNESGKFVSIITFQQDGGGFSTSPTERVVTGNMQRAAGAYLNRGIFTYSAATNTRYMRNINSAV